MIAVGNYISRAAAAFGEAWNRFWFAPKDPLPLAVLRWIVGGLALWTVGSYGPDLMRYFGPFGVLPLDTIRELSDRARLSVLDHADDATALFWVYGCSLAILAAFTVGLWTRVTSILSLVVFISFFQRAVVLTSFVEPIVAMLLLYLCLGPSGAALSVDAWLRRRKSPDAVLLAQAPSYQATLALRLIQVHTTIAYFMMFSGKSHGSFIWWNGTAVWWLIARPDACLVELRWLYEYPYIINFWTSAIVVFELAFALLIWNRTARPLMIFLSAVMWTGTALLTGLVPFCLAMFAAGLAFVSADQWRALAAPKPAA